MKRLLLFLLLTGSCSAQLFSFGLKAGVPLTGLIDAPQNTTSRYIIGPTLELKLPFGLAVEGDALYRRYKYSTSLYGSSAFPSLSTGSTGAWEFPLLVKYRFPMRVVRPYVDAGISWDTLIGLQQSTSPTICAPDQIGCKSTTVPNPPVNKGTTAGFVLGGGVDVHALFLHVSPEIRFTHWGTQHFVSSSSVLSSNQNQAEFLIGFTL